ncbi:biopolymer transporter ExbD [Opitutales bacterium]|jgi:biopolymer transport protein ExbD|nr:biopolymer transporter ExbD [Opitutales bacterium]
MGIQAQEEEEAEVSMSPLIDCVFLLLIFFIVSTMTKKQNKDIDISLPVSSSAEKLIPSNQELVIGIDQKKNIFFEGEPVSLNGLHAELREIGVLEPDRRIRLDADEKTPLGRVVEILDLCQFNNLTNVGIRSYDEHYNKR